MAEWLSARGTGIIRKSEFIQHMRDLTGAANAPRVLAALALFSFEGAADPLKMSLFVYAKAQRVRQTVDAWFNGKTVKINTIVHRDL
ncbi:MAG: hypothetical protein U5K74_15705 [Gemmatimonadaceae bacterium]|nr:hypothetical protein [Gemmatimonadaceae bacterium]